MLSVYSQEIATNGSLKNSQLLPFLSLYLFICQPYKSSHYNSKKCYKLSQYCVTKFSFKKHSWWLMDTWFSLGAYKPLYTNAAETVHYYKPKQTHLSSAVADTSSRLYSVPSILLVHTELQSVHLRSPTWSLGSRDSFMHWGQAAQKWQYVILIAIDTLL